MKSFKSSINWLRKSEIVTEFIKKYKDPLIKYFELIELSKSENKFSDISINSSEYFVIVLD